MKRISFLLILNVIIFQSVLIGQIKETNDDENGDWTAQYVTLYNTTEAEMMVRSGDIDNLGFGWPAEFDPFSGLSTPSHGYPWEADTTDASGTDRIMVISSYDGSPPHGQDGYTSYTTRPENLPRPILLSYNTDDIVIESAALQIFVDDFQAPVWRANYFATINGVQAPYIAEIINDLSQTGPVGKIINVAIPEAHLYLLERDSLSIYFDDNTTGAGDGYAIDFVKLLINPTGFSYTAKIYGYVKDAATLLPLNEVIVSTSGAESVLTDEDGFYMLENIPAGITSLSATKFSYDTTSILVDLQAGDSIRKDFSLNEILDAEFIGDVTTGTSLPHTVNFTDLSSMNPTEWLWDFGDGNTSTEQNPSHVYTDGGFFTVSLTASDGSASNTETKETYVRILIEDIDENQVISDLNIRPNPVSDIVIISFTLNDASAMKIDICDKNGRILNTIGNQHYLPGNFEKTLDLQNLSGGLYFLRIHAEKRDYVRKLIISE